MPAQQASPHAFRQSPTGEIRSHSDERPVAVVPKRIFYDKECNNLTVEKAFQSASSTHIVQGARTTTRQLPPKGIGFLFLIDRVSNQNNTSNILPARFEGVLCSDFIRARSVRLGFRNLLGKVRNRKIGTGRMEKM